MGVPKKYKPLLDQLRVGRSRTGLGLFTDAPIQRGTFIIEYTGEVISTEEADRRLGRYLFAISSRSVIDSSSRENLARYINHSCKPNTESDVISRRVLFFAKRRIRAGEELTVDYGKEYFDTFIAPYGCLCDACATVNR
jgi:hypothetical protein